MSKRLQVLLREEEWRELRAAAKQQGLSVSAWVRRAIREARRGQPEGDLATKLEAIRSAAAHDFPTADIEEMLAEIERGYASRASE